MSLAPAGPHPNPLPKGEGDLYSFGVVGYHDPARGDSRIAPVRDSRGCGGSRPSLFRERDMFSGQSSMRVAAGTPRYENRGAGWWVRSRGICAASPPPGFRPRIGVRRMLLRERRSGVAVWT